MAIGGVTNTFGRRLYIAVCGVLLGIVGSTRVHAWCVGDDFVYGDQYCSCNNRIA